LDTYLAIASKRDERDYAERPLPDDLVRRVLEAGRHAGSAANRQPWRFVVVENPGLREEVAGLVWAPENVRRAALVVVLAVRARGPAAFDAGRAAQNMMLAAWNEGVASCPNGSPDAAALSRALELAPEEEQPLIVLTFGYPERPRDPASRSPEEWMRGLRRRPFDEVVRRL
jgi:nitroreductase